MAATPSAAPRKAAPRKSPGEAVSPPAPGSEKAVPKRAAKIRPDVLDTAGDCALALAADHPWSEISLRDIARAAGVGFAELYSRAPGKDALLDHLARRFDTAALAAAEDDASAEAHDRLFEAVMARLEAMEPHRAALIAIAQARGMLAIAPHLPRTARALLEAAGIDTGGPLGALRIAGLTSAWARILQVWRDDQGALNRTMAEIDKLLHTLNRRLKRIGAGF
jgi:AcrR family transcriptional regulator